MPPQHQQHNTAAPLVVFCGPSGSGKSTLIQRLQRHHAGVFSFSVSHTSRAARDGEKDGVHYHFLSRDQMLQAIAGGDFLEHAEYSGNLYGTSWAEVRRIQSLGAVCILDIDIQGVRQVKAQTQAKNAHFVFICPPSIEELERRLRARNTESEQALKRRLDVAVEEIKYCSQPGAMHVTIVNQHLDSAYQQLENYLRPLIEKFNGKNDGAQQ